MRAALKGCAIAALLLLSGAAASAAADPTPADPTPATAANAAQAPAQAAEQPFLTLTGTMTRADHEHYREIPFSLPDGVRRLTVRFSYEGREEHAAIDMGLFDPERFRGWSGGARNGLTLAASDATPGYFAGPLPAGTWRLLLGVPNLRPGARAPWKAEIFIERTVRITSFADGPINEAPGWYRGDLHMHSGNSDAKCSSQRGRKVPCPVYRTLEAASARGLDFIALTDHNTTAQAEALRALQPAFDTLLLVPGREVTTFFGHANVFGLTDFLDWRMDAPTAAAARTWIDAANRAGAVVSINHPGAPSGEDCMGCGWQVRDLPSGSIAAIEVVNGGALAETGHADGPAQGFGLWESMLASGAHVTAIGGSDNHDALASDHAGNPVGTPATVVYMPQLSVAGLLAGIRSGRVFIDLDGTRSRLLEFSASSGGSDASMGAVLHVPAGGNVEFTAHVEGVESGTVSLVIDGRPGTGAPIAGATHRRLPAWRSDGGFHHIRPEVRDAAGRLILIGNPVYIEPLN